MKRFLLGPVKLAARDGGLFASRLLVDRLTGVKRRVSVRAPWRYLEKIAPGIGKVRVAGWFSKLTKGVRKAFGKVKSALNSQVAKAIKAVVKHPVFRSAVASLAVAFPPVGIPATMAVEGVNLALKASGKVEELARPLVDAAKRAGTPSARPSIARSVRRVRALASLGAPKSVATARMLSKVARAHRPMRARGVVTLRDRRLPAMIAHGVVTYRDGAKVVASLVNSNGQLRSGGQFQLRK